MNRCIAITLIFAFLLGPCASSAWASGLPPAAFSAVTIPPQRINHAVAALDTIARNMQRKTGVPGMSIAVVHNDKVVYLKGFGVRKAGTNERVDADTVFELASVSKPVGAAVIAGAVGRGVVKWTDPLRKYLPGFALADPYVSRTITIADMYAHRSGLPDHAGDLLEDLGYKRAAVIKRLAFEPLDPFRITYHYTNFGLTAAAQAVANAAHTSWEDLSRDTLYRPLGMNSTSSRFADYWNAKNKAILHVRIGNTWVAKYTRDADAQSPAGGVSSSARDMAQWMRFELANGKYNGKQVVSEAALLVTRNPNLMLAPLSSPVSRATFYGLGINVGYDPAGRLRLTHSGAFSNGGATTVFMLPSENLGIVVLTNGAPIGVPEAIAASFLDLAEFGKPERDWLAAYAQRFAALSENPSPLAHKKPPANPAPARANAAYAGTYNSRFYGPVTIAAQSGQLVMLIGPRRESFPLTHWDGDTFSYMPSGENANGIAGITFAFPAGATHAKRMTIDYLNENGLGTFTR
ncbi:MAG TPA: serine hydrolase [Candidatus Rubrimentiphilum sp.]|nr:serine hydrolase [Candidatus Rubrimentiphilum sp.]